MPPGPAYNWLCVASAACDILVRAASAKAAQASAGYTAHNTVVWRQNVPTTASGGQGMQLPDSRRNESGLDASIPMKAPLSAPADTRLRTRPQEDLVDASNPQTRLSPAAEPAVEVSIPVQPKIVSDKVIEVEETKVETRNEPAIPIATPQSDKSLDSNGAKEEKEPLLELERVSLSQQTAVQSEAPVRQLQSSKVPSSRIGRLFHYGSLAASLGYGAASEMIRRTATSSESQSPLIMTEANITRLVSKLSQMRGAALKLGQFLSIQDTHVLPADIDQIFRRVQDSAHYMPDWQMERVVSDALGPDWSKMFSSFDRVPFAAASIGQVHTATLAAAVSPTGVEARVAVKIQFPNIGNSIASDLGYVSLLLTAGRLLPKGLFLDRTMQAMKEELADECDYTREARFLRAFGDQDHLGGDPRFKVPWVWDQSTERVLVMEHVDGKSVGEAALAKLGQQDRDDIAARVIELCLKELFEFRMMQTDPNWSNFLWNPKSRQVELVDFGATREYSKEFMDDWLRLLQAAAQEDRSACIEFSLRLGYLTGEENELMLDAHVQSMILLATPFRTSTAQPFTFGPGTLWADITAQIRTFIPVMLQHRLTPPPRETYSLNRQVLSVFQAAPADLAAENSVARFC
ncbi:unnamed protein product [Mycena citricolor]|uniref:ABC1 atypical kinase-like domain-containing protein n=1 Tax=Mycena citricolor TaxID=2018698 RepID=A0AAD2Q3F5_9AGAR|nr:unnamed protein product [Mycena citricolor]